MAPFESLLLMTLLVLAGSAPVEPPPPQADSSVDELLRLFNVSRQELEASRQHLAAHPSAAARPAVHLSADSAVSTAQQAMRNSAAIQRKQEVYRQVMGFVSQNGRPLPSMPVSGAVPPMFAPFARPEVAPEFYGQTNVGRVRYIQPSCDSPKHTDDELWSTSSSSMHLFFNLSGIQSQARHGHQLYVIGAKLRLLKFAEGEAEPAVVGRQDWPAELSSEQEGPDAPVQTLQTHPFFEPLAPTDEEKIRVSVHNYTRALKRHRAHKKKLLDSQMALAKEEGYLELDVKPAARWWLAPNGRNFGLSLEVEDMDGQRKPVSSYFRARNCSIEGLKMDELTDVRDVASPVLELTVVEVPEGRHIVELPTSGIKTRSDEVENSEDSEQASEQEDSPRRSRNHRLHDEQSDEAGRFFHRPSGKHRPRSRLPLAVPTLATLEDHDLFREPSANEDSDQSEDESKLARKPANLFIQRIVQHHQRQRANVQ